MGGAVPHACYRMDLPPIGSQHSGCLTTSDRSQTLLEDVVEILQNLDKLRGLETSIAQSEDLCPLCNKCSLVHKAAVAFSYERGPALGAFSSHVACPHVSALDHPVAYPLAFILSWPQGWLHLMSVP